MTMKPKAKKFRVRRATGVTPASGGTRPAAGAPTQDNALLGEMEDGFGDAPYPGSAAHDRASGAQAAPPEPAPGAEPEVPVEQELAAIRQEGLTGRQLRMARRTAQKHGLRPASDFDAVRLLRHRGIDPFARTNMLELIVNDAQSGAAAQTPAQAQGNSQTLPATMRQPSVPAPAGQAYDENTRASEIMRVQRDLATRRRKRLALLAVRLMFFVMLPTFLIGYYFFTVATPLYATHSEFLIQKAEASAGGDLSGMLGGTSFATVQESITVQSYLESREAMLRLDAELGFRAHFSGEDIDPLTRLAPDASDEDVYDTYLKHLDIGYDPTEGLVRMEVVAADAETSQRFSAALITYAEERVDQMTQRLRESQMADANSSFEDAELRMVGAQQRVIELQEQRGVLSAEAEVNTVFQQISTFELQLQQERLRLLELQSNIRPNQTRVEVAERNIERLEALISSLRDGLTATSGADDVSLARISSELIVAQADLQTRQLMLSQALQAMETARLEANRQSLYLSIGVFPVAPDEAAYPRAFENTLLAFLVFSGIYLLVSMTIAILREQISA
ncbi:capsule biosynthesis protein [Rhodophyticola sp. CCM32]|uniref:capsule biosynthesis protein n=1 Tax=Rhodophyticola sp. CCM32 TaxID=2916397 RepID=UPI00107F826F|nr:capsule biosynthesis protein [Rhodophyticola sp. CCM32]QBY02473.1 capsule biosynthesis protein [Rhodophyticola sp. CCM32]